VRSGSPGTLDPLGCLGFGGCRPGRPNALAGLPRPDAIFVGGGVVQVLEACWAALSAGGRLVANAVTLESEAALTGWHAKVGGALTRIEISRAAPLGNVTGWRPMLPVTRWS